VNEAALVSTAGFSFFFTKFSFGNVAFSFVVFFSVETTVEAFHL